MVAKGIPTNFAFAIVPNETDWSWIPNAPNMSQVPYGSQLMVGDYNSSVWLNSQFPTSLDATATNPNNWTFAMSQFAFGYTNITSNGTETLTYKNLTTEYYNQTLVTLGHPGIALPAPVYEPYVAALQALTGGIWTCRLSYGYSCYAPVSCQTFTGGPGSSYNLTGVDFRIVFES
jgi:hypothetical protein